jgi:hypothetical protein
MKLSNKYNIPQSTINQMVNDGVIGCQWTQYEKVYEEFQALYASGKSKSEIYMDLSIKYKMSDRTVRHIISIIGKI